MRLIGKLVVIPTFFLVVTSMSVYAKDVSKHFAIADIDQDGRLSIDEVVTCAVKRADNKTEELLKRYDTNKDGCIAKDELKEKKTQKLGLSAADANNDGNVSKEEWASFLRKKSSEMASANFKLRDANSDAFITLDEIKQFKTEKGVKKEGIEELLGEIDELFSK